MAMSLAVQQDQTGYNVETQFANVLQDYQLNDRQDPFKIIEGLIPISASKAFSIGEELGADGTNGELQEQFEYWDLETKLWHLVKILYSFRYSNKEELLNEYKSSSLAIKQENYLRKNPKIREMSLIINWLQVNSRSVDVNINEEFGSKWPNTKIAVCNRDLNVLANKNSDFVGDLDVDSPLRSNKTIHPNDEAIDSKNFRTIYKLLLTNRIQEAVDFANNTGNYALSLILIGATQDYVDPLIDNNERNMLDDSISQQNKASGIRHKLLWKKTVYKLSQQENLNKNERLIYNYLSGGDLSLNLRESADNWEEYLLLYLNQLYLYNLENFIQSNLPSDIANEETLSFSVPKPQSSTIDDILNTMSRSENKIAEQGSHPLRIISGGIMINQVSSLLHNIIKGKKSDLLMQPNLIRVIAHLAIFHLIMDDPDVKDITTIITLYISKLSDYKLTDLIPIYLSFIPNQLDAREIYSLFLSSITDAEERLKHIQIAKKFTQIVPSTSSSDIAMITSKSSEDEMANVLRRTVEIVMKETESLYKPSSVVIVQDDTSVDETDNKLYGSVDWFYKNSMYEDSISASIIVIRRFLLCGKLSALKRFAKGKSFKKLIKDYDFELHTKSISNPNSVSNITEEHKQELIEYELLIEGLNLIEDWKQFLKDNKINENLSASAFWKSKDIENSIEKISKKITNIIFKWFEELIKNSDERSLFEEFRSMYIPYLLMELLQIYQYSRFNDWNYMRKAFKLINEVANEHENDFLKCFIRSGRLNEFLIRAGEISVIAGEKGIKGIFY